MRIRITIASFLACLLVSACAQEKYKRPDAETYYKDAQAALLAKKCWQAQEMFRNLLSEFPGSHYVDDAQYGLGQAYYCSEDYIEASFEFERLLNEYPVSPFVDQARYQIGMCYYNQSRSIHHDQEETKRAILEFERFVEDFPNSERADDARNRIEDLRSKLARKYLMIAESYMKWREYPSAVIYAQEVMLQYPESVVVNAARFVMARARHKMGELDEALAILMDLSTLNLGAELKSQVAEELDAVRESISDRPAARDAQPGDGGQAARQPAAGR